MVNCFVGIKTESVHAGEEILRESRNCTSARGPCVVPALMREGPVGTLSCITFVRLNRFVFPLQWMATQLHY